MKQAIQLNDTKPILIELFCTSIPQNKPGRHKVPFVVCATCVQSHKNDAHVGSYSRFTEYRS